MVVFPELAVSFLDVEWVGGRWGSLVVVVLSVVLLPVVTLAFLLLDDL